MTNFAIAVERGLPLNDGWAGVLFDFFFFIGTIPFVKHTGSERVLTESARVSSMPDCFISVEQGSPSFACACSESNSELVRLFLCSTHYHPACSFWSIRRWNFKFKFIVAKKWYDAHLDNWYNHCSSWNCCIGSGILVCPRKSILGMLM